MAKRLKDRILEALKKERLTALELSKRLGTSTNYVTYELLTFEKKGLIEYDLATEKWRLKRR